MKLYTLKVSYDACAAAEVQKYKICWESRTDSTLPFSSYFFWATSARVCVCASSEACRSMCVQAIQRTLCAWVCVASPRGTAGRCGSQTVGIEGRIKFGSACSSSHTGTEEPRMHSFLFHSLSLSIPSVCFCIISPFSLQLSLLVQLDINLHPPSSQHTPIRCFAYYTEEITASVHFNTSLPCQHSWREFASKNRQKTHTYKDIKYIKQEHHIYAFIHSDILYII